MYNDRKNTLTLKLGQWNTMEWQADCVDPSLDDILEGFYGCLVGHGYDPQTVIATLKEWAGEKLETINK